ncbi:MAG: 2-succinyl-5-enolpyruvyl-6-hydroxy-3-cyclohexene-1-carboxylic-acid synthase [Bdellovibrionia bacterium]
MTNLQLAAQVIQELVNIGVKEFILCAGARNSPFIEVFANNSHLKVYNFFEERSAAFFALGRIARTRLPVAVLTTSGTAAAELLPAAIEATYSSLPLIMVTADRPKRYRGSGAPQSIEQLGLFSYYVEAALDLDFENSQFSLTNLSWKKPIQINTCFSEPLLVGEVPLIQSADSEAVSKLDFVPANSYVNLRNFLSNHKPVIVVGYLPRKAQSTVVQFLKSYSAPVYLEGISGLRGHPELQELEIVGGEETIHALIQHQTVDSLMRLGGVPTLRLWRDLEEKLKDLPVLSVSYNHYTGLSRPSTHINCLEVLKQVAAIRTSDINCKVLEADKLKNKKMLSLLEKFPHSEPSLLFMLSTHLKDKNVYLGNSLPIREWDLVADRMSPPADLVGNRGANGIDGQLSSFLGWAEGSRENWAIVGDLTTLYDLSAPWVAGQLSSDLKLRIVVINNRGGQIFNRMFGKEIYLNRHNTGFAAFAQMWNWSYQCWSKIPDSFQLENLQLIELSPDEEQTHQFWRELKEI